MSNRQMTEDAFKKMRAAAVTAGHKPGVKFFSYSRFRRKAEKRARWESNRARRAALYSSIQGAPGNKLAEWHTTLDALSGGTA
jgi:hypothetical protein